MKFWGTLLLSTVLAAAAIVPTDAQQSPEGVTVAAFPFEEAVPVEGLGNPFEIRQGPEGWISVTERSAGRITGSPEATD